MCTGAGGLVADGDGASVTIVEGSAATGVRVDRVGARGAQRDLAELETIDARAGGDGALLTVAHIHGTEIQAVTQVVDGGDVAAAVGEEHGGGTHGDVGAGDARTIGIVAEQVQPALEGDRVGGTVRYIYVESAAGSGAEEKWKGAVSVVVEAAVVPNVVVAPLCT